jgi:predicted DNA-binding protein YlxM (UPF0122 family)
MKKSIIILLLAVLPLIGFAQKDYKLVEQSPKNKPSWLTNGNTFGAFLIQANKVATLEEAQNNVMASLMSQVASSIAVQVVGEIEKNIDWTVVELEGRTQEQYLEQVKDNTTLKIAKLPALQGFSITKAEIYWEKYQNKKTKEYSYDYYMLYPFSSYELEELIAEYNAQEKAINDKIDNFRNILDEIENVDVMLENINEMKSMIKEYGEEDASKYNKLKNNISLYENLIANIYIDVLENANGKLVIQLKHDEKILKTKSLPQLKGNCARDFTKKHNGTLIEIGFNTFDCYEQDDNYVEIKFNFGKKRVVNKVLINL